MRRRATRSTAPRRRLRPLGFALAFALVASSGCSSLPENPDATLPPDVREFVVRENRCDVWRQALADGDPRREFLENRIAENCGSRSEEIARLTAKYPNDPAIRNVLRFYESEPNRGAD